MQSSMPKVIVSNEANSFAKFRSQVSAAATASSSSSASQQAQSHDQDASMNAIAAYSDS
jgi:hypothetical protein